MHHCSTGIADTCEPTPVYACVQVTVALLLPRRLRFIDENIQLPEKQARMLGITCLDVAFVMKLLRWYADEVALSTDFATDAKFAWLSWALSYLQTAMSKRDSTMLLAELRIIKCFPLANGRLTCIDKSSRVAYLPGTEYGKRFNCGRCSCFSSLMFLHTGFIETCSTSAPGATGANTSLKLLTLLGAVSADTFMFIKCAVLPWMSELANACSAEPSVDMQLHLHGHLIKYARVVWGIHWLTQSRVWICTCACVR